MEFLPWCIDPYVKIYLLFNGQRIAKKKTHVKKRTLNPVFNESFVFELPHMEEGLKNISLEFMLLDWDRVTKNEVRIFQVWLKKVFKKKMQSCTKWITKNFVAFRNNISLCLNFILFLNNGFKKPVVLFWKTVFNFGFQVIGRLELGGDKCEGTALHHWNEVLASPRRQIAEWHKLRE